MSVWLFDHPAAVLGAVGFFGVLAFAGALCMAAALGDEQLAQSREGGNVGDPESAPMRGEAPELADGRRHLKVVR